MSWIKKNIKLLIFCAIIVAIFVLNHIFGWTDYLSNSENLSFLSDMIHEHFVTVALIYIGLTIVACVALALPGVTFAILAGILFGPWWGTLFCLIATTLGAILAFIIGRFFLQDSIRPMIEKNKLLKKILFDDAGRSDIVLLGITRLVPLFPYNIQNFAYGITGISLQHYSLYTFIFMIPGVALYTIGTAGFTSDGNKLLYFGIAVALLVLVLLLGWYIKKKYLGAEMRAAAVDISEFVKNSEYRQALELPETVTEEYELLAQGEYNVNFITTHPISGRKLVLRVNCGSQMHLDNQIRYEADAISELEKSGRTPHLLYVDDSKKYCDYGILVMDYISGDYPDYESDEDMLAAVECLADIHCTAVDKSKFIAPEASLAAILEECEEMFSVYENSEIAPLENKEKIRSLLNRGKEIAAEMNDEADNLPYRCCINTELNSTNFLIDHSGEKAFGRLVDWEKPLYGDPAQDLGHMLAPTTTFWKTDVIYSRERINWLIDEYIGCVADRYDTTGLKDRVAAFISINCLRGVTWCAMAWVQYRTEDKQIRNDDTAKKLDEYMKMSFLNGIEEQLR